MADKPTYEELGKSVKELERESFEGRRLEEANIQSTDRFRLVFERSNDAISFTKSGTSKTLIQGPAS